MAEPISKTQRWLDLIAFLVKHRFPVSVDQIMEAVPAYAAKRAGGSETDRESVRRMFERDKDELRALGMPLEKLEYSIDYGTQRAEGYALSSRDFYLPYLRIVGEDADAGGGEGKAAGKGKKRPGVAEVEIERDDAATAVEALRRVADLPGFGLAEEARSALRKVAFDVDVDDLAVAPVLYVDRPGVAEVRDRMALLTDAVRARKKVRFRYHGIYRGEPTQRAVAPYGLLFQHGHWYLIGHDELRDDVRVFRLGRMEGVEVNRAAAKTPDFEVPADFDLREYTRLEPWELGAGDDGPLEARVRFAFPASLWVARNGYGALVAEEDGGDAVRQFDVHQVGPFLRWLQGFAGEAIVASPPELRDEQVSLARETAAVYREARRG
jgi:proteasome accessory factor B